MNEYDPLRIDTWRCIPDTMECPFCGAKPVFRQGDGGIVIACENSECDIKPATQPGGYGAIQQAWIRRNNSDRRSFLELCKRVGEMNTELERLAGALGDIGNEENYRDGNFFPWKGCYPTTPQKFADAVLNGPMVAKGGDAGRAWAEGIIREAEEKEGE